MTDLLGGDIALWVTSIQILSDRVSIGLSGNSSVYKNFCSWSFLIKPEPVGSKSYLYLMPYALYHMPYAICHMPYTICLMPYAICLMPYAICHMLYAICHMFRTLCPISYALSIRPKPYAAQSDRGWTYTLCLMHYALSLCPMPYAHSDRSHTTSACSHAQLQ